MHLEIRCEGRKNAQVGAIRREDQDVGTLNDYTPDILRDDDIVCSAWRHAEVGRNDRLLLRYKRVTSWHFLFRTNQLAWRVVARADGKPQEQHEFNGALAA